MTDYFKLNSRVDDELFIAHDVNDTASTGTRRGEIAARATADDRGWNETNSRIFKFRRHDAIQVPRAGVKFQQKKVVTVE